MQLRCYVYISVVKCGFSVSIPEHAVFNQLSGVVSSSYTPIDRLSLRPCTTKLVNLPSTTIKFELLYSNSISDNIKIDNKLLTTKSPLVHLAAVGSRNVSISYSTEDTSAVSFVVKYSGNIWLQVEQFSLL